MKEFIEKLNKRLEEIKDDTGKNCSKVDFGKCNKYKNCGVCLVDRTIDIVNKLAEEHNGGWIPCSERLPEKDCWVITCDKEGNIHIFFYASGYFRESFGGKPITEHNERFYVPIAWQPLPDPYKDRQQSQKGGAS